MSRISTMLLILASLLAVVDCRGDEKPAAKATEPKTPAIVQEFDAKVVSVTDGDTIRVLTDDKREVRVRFEGIDAPEKGQAFSRQSTEALKAAVAGKTVRVLKTGQDRYGRTLGYVVIDGRNANLELVAAGWAWHFKKYNNEQRFADAETEARNGKLGLWADENPVAPWEHRSQTKKPESGTTGKAD